MIKFIVAKIIKYWAVILPAFLWLCVWATYNTDIFRIFSTTFPSSFLDFFHGVRAFLPFLGLFIAIIFLFKNNKLKIKKFGPLSLLAIYAAIGIFASFFSENILVSLYWGVLYISAIIVIFYIFSNGDFDKKSSLIIRMNWIIGGLIAIGLTLLFFMHPGVISLSTFNDFLNGKRPYESLGNVKAESNIFGMVGSRPTGLGRYAGLLAVVMFANIWRKSKGAKVFFASSFVLFFLILLFSRSRTSIVAFFVALLTILWFKSRSKISFIFICLSIASLIYFTGFYTLLNSYLVKENPQQTSSAQYYSSEKYIMSTLSGRVDTIWPKVFGVFMTSPVFGRGFQADRIFLDGLHTHNTFLQALIQSGIIGTFFFCFAFLILWIGLLHIFKKNPQNIIIVETIGVVAFFATRSITESSAYFGADLLFLLPILAYVHFYPRENKLDSYMDFYNNKIDLTGITDVVNKIKYWINNEAGKMHWVVVTGMHGIVESCKQEDFKCAISHADMFVPDGISLVWLARLKGFNINKRVSGADLMVETLKLSEKEGFKNYFYGDTEETLKELSKKFPNIKKDFYSPPFRELTKDEDEKIIQKINEAKPDILWVGLGLPKQEKWIYQHKDKLNVPVVIGVGAAFKFLSGQVKRAPKWVGDLGFEWLWRLVHEPKTVWKRVFIDIPIFSWLVVKDFFGNKLEN